MRLTKKKWHQLNGRKKDWFEYVLNKKYTSYDRLYKLGELEDIEEELGIDLITLFKALNNGVYDLLGNHWNVRLNKEEGKWYLYTMLIKYSHTQVEEIYKDRLSFSTYGKTWALTKEELI